MPPPSAPHAAEHTSVSSLLQPSAVNSQSQSDTLPFAHDDTLGHPPPSVPGSAPAGITQELPRLRSPSPTNSILSVKRPLDKHSFGKFMNIKAQRVDEVCPVAGHAIHEPYRLSYPAFATLSATIEGT